MSEPVCGRVPVVGPRASLKSLPLFYVTREEAREHVARGEAVWLKAAKAIKLHARPEQLLIRGASCKVTEPTITANADGVLWAKVIVAGWRGYLHNTLGQPFRVHRGGGLPACVDSLTRDDEELIYPPDKVEHYAPTFAAGNDLA